MMLRNVLLFDTESTGLSHETDVCIEVGLVLYSLEHFSVIKAYSTVLRVGRENTAEAVNHIPSAVLDMGANPSQVWATADAWSKSADAVLAHNSDFDRQWVPACTSSMLELPWIDTCDGVDWPRQSKPSSNLISLALDHGLGVVDPHRALQDCFLIARLLARCNDMHYDVQVLLARGLRPRATYESLEPYERKDEVAAAGFHWDRDKRVWTRKMAREDASRLPFRVREVG